MGNKLPACRNSFVQILEMKQFFLKCFILVFLTFIFLVIFAQSSVKGKIFNTSSGTALEGAFVSIIHTTYRTETGADGSFVLRNIPAGKFEIAAECIGFATLSKKIEVEPNSDAEVNITLTQQ